MQQIVDPFMPVTAQVRHPNTVPERPAMPTSQQAPAHKRPISDMVVRPAHRMIAEPPKIHGQQIKQIRTVANQPVYADIKKPTRTPDQSVFEHQFKPASPSAGAVAAVEQPKTTARTKSLLKTLEIPAIILGSVIIGYLMQSLQLGEIAIGAYAIAAIIFKIASRTTFALALLSLFVIVMLTIAKPGSTLATNFAVYTFLLLVVGTISLGREVRAEAA